MPVLTRSQTRFIKERETAYAELRYLNSLHTIAVSDMDKYLTLSNVVAFITENEHIINLLKKDAAFALCVNAKCTELLANTHCTRKVAKMCKAYRLQSQQYNI